MGVSAPHLFTGELIMGRLKRGSRRDPQSIIESRRDLSDETVRVLRCEARRLGLSVDRLVEAFLEDYVKGGTDETMDE